MAHQGLLGTFRAGQSSVTNSHAAVQASRVCIHMRDPAQSGHRQRQAWLKTCCAAGCAGGEGPLLQPLTVSPPAATTGELHRTRRCTRHPPQATPRRRCGSAWLGGAWFSCCTSCWLCQCSPTWSPLHRCPCPAAQGPCLQLVKSSALWQVTWHTCNHALHHTTCQAQAQVTRVEEHSG